MLVKYLCGITVACCVTGGNSCGSQDWWSLTKAVATAPPLPERTMVPNLDGGAMVIFSVSFEFWDLRESFLYGSFLTF